MIKHSKHIQTKSNIKTAYLAGGNFSKAAISIDVTTPFPATAEGSDRVITYDSDVQLKFYGVIIDRVQLRYMDGNTWIGQKDLFTNLTPEHPDINFQGSGGMYYTFTFTPIINIVLPSELNFTVVEIVSTPLISKSST